MSKEQVFVNTDKEYLMELEQKSEGQRILQRKSRGHGVCYRCTPRSLKVEERRMI